MASSDEEIICNLLPAFPDLSIQDAWYLWLSAQFRHALIAGITMAVVGDSLSGAAW